MNIGELFITLGFNADTVKVKDFVKSVAELPVMAVEAVAALAGIDYELLQITKNAMDAAVSFQMFGEETGLSWQELQRWQIAAEQANVSAGAVASSVSAIQRNLAEISLGRGNIAPFQILGIGTQQDAFGVLTQLRERLRGVQPAMATNLVTQMGIDPSMVHILQMSNEEFAKLGKNIRGMTSGEEGSFLKAKQVIVEFGQAAKYWGFDLVYNLIEGLNLLYAKLSQMKGVLMGIEIALAGVAIAFFPVTAAIVGLLLVLEDLSVYFRGGNSVTGSAIEGIKKLGDAMKENFKGLGAFGQIASIAGLLTNPVPTIGGAVSAGISKIINQNVTMHINSTAPAQEVGKAAAEHLNKAASQASLQTNQQGY